MIGWFRRNFFAWIATTVIIWVLWNIGIGIEATFSFHTQLYYNLHSIATFIMSPIFGGIVVYEWRQN